MQQDTTDYGPAPFVGSIEDAVLENGNYRTTLWTGSNLQVTLMSIEPDHDIGLEVHETHDQFLRIDQGSADVVMGPNQNELSNWQAYDGDAIIIPAGTWHNLTCVGQETLKLYSIYAPPEHPRGTVHVTKQEADAAEATEHGNNSDVGQTAQTSVEPQQDNIQPSEQVAPVEDVDANPMTDQQDAAQPDNSQYTPPNPFGSQSQPVVETPPAPMPESTSEQNT